jgi:hypothetical protein
MESGTTIEIDLKSALRFIGKAARPAYPGFMVMNTAQSSLKLIFESSKTTIAALALMADYREMTTCDMSDRTCGSILLNSSKHTQIPLDANPLKNRQTPAYS